MFNKNRNELKELVELCIPLTKFIEKKSENTNECYRVVVIDNEVEMLKTELYGMGGFSFKDTAQEIPIQEQYVGKCQHCGYENKFKLSVGTHLPDGVYLKFCMKCSKEIQYFKMA